VAPLSSDSRVTTVTTPYSVPPAQRSALVSRDQHKALVVVALKDSSVQAQSYINQVVGEVHEALGFGDEVRLAPQFDDGRGPARHRQRHRQMHETMRQQRQRPSGLLILSERHPGSLQDKIGDDMLDREDEHPSDQRAYRNRRRHGGKRQS